MTLTPSAELEELCGKVTEYTEGGVRIIHLTRVQLPPGSVPATAEGLLYLGQHSGYMSRLFLAERTQKETNWTQHRVLDRQWYTWSYQGVSPEQRPAQVLLQQLSGLKL